MLFGLLSGILAGLNTVLFSLALSTAPFLSSGLALFLAPFVSAFLHDSFSSIWIAIYMTIKGQLKNALAASNTKEGRCILVAALFAGPLGMTGNLLAISYIGPALTTIISSLYPAVGALLAYIFLKERMNASAILGLALSIVGIVILGYSPGNSVSNFGLGFMWALMAVLGWASEAVICSYGMKSKRITPEQSLQLRQLTSACIYGFLVIPLLGGLKFTFSILQTETAIMLIIIALFGSLSCIFYYKGINRIGATKAMSLNITYSAWAMIFSVILLGSSLNIKSILCCSLIMVGSILASK